MAAHFRRKSKPAPTTKTAKNATDILKLRDWLECTAHRSSAKPVPKTSKSNDKVRTPNALNDFALTVRYTTAEQKRFNKIVPRNPERAVHLRRAKAIRVSAEGRV